MSLVREQDGSPRAALTCAESWRHSCVERRSSERGPTKSAPQLRSYIQPPPQRPRIGGAEGYHRPAVGLLEFVELSRTQPTPLNEVDATLESAGHLPRAAGGRLRNPWNGDVRKVVRVRSVKRGAIPVGSRPHQVTAVVQGAGASRIGEPRIGEPLAAGSRRCSIRVIGKGTLEIPAYINELVTQR